MFDNFYVNVLKLVVPRVYEMLVKKTIEATSV